MEKRTNKRGGARTGAGRPPKQDGPRKTYAVYLTKEEHATLLLLHGSLPNWVKHSLNN